MHALEGHVPAPSVRTHKTINYVERALDNAEHGESRTVRNHARVFLTQQAAQEANQGRITAWRELLRLLRRHLRDLDFFLLVLFFRLNPKGFERVATAEEKTIVEQLHAKMNTDPMRAFEGHPPAFIYRRWRPPLHYKPSF